MPTESPTATDRGPSRTSQPLPCRPQVIHHVDRGHDEADGPAPAPGQRGTQLGQRPLHPGVPGQEQADGPPHEPEQDVDAPPGDRGLAQQLLGQSEPGPSMLGPHQAVLGQGQGLGQRHGIAGSPRPLHRSQHEVGATGLVGGLGQQAGPQPDGQRVRRADPGQRPPLQGMDPRRDIIEDLRVRDHRWSSRRTEPSRRTLIRLAAGRRVGAPRRS